MNKKKENRVSDQDKYFGLFNKIADPIFIFEKENCRILDSNAAVTRNYGYTKEEIKNMSLLDLHPQNEVEKVRKAVRIINKDVPFTFTHIKKNGVKIFVEMLSDHIDFEGRCATITIVRDVSDRVKVEKELKRKAIQNSLLYEIGQRLTSELDLGTLLKIVVTSIRDAFDYYGVMLLLMDKDGKKLVMQSISGGYSKVFPRNMPIKVGEGMIGQAALTRQTQISGDVTKNPDYVIKAKEVTKSELSVPLMNGDRIIGVLDFQSDKENAFDQSDVTAAETLSSQIASAIENANLYNQAQIEIEDRQKAEKALRKSKNRLQSAKKETDTILENVEEGLFILDKTYKIGSQFSTALTKIMHTKDLKQKYFLDVLRVHFSEELLENIKDYLDLLLNSEIDEETLSDLNPLSQVEMSFQVDEELLPVEKVLAFKFRRIQAKDEITGLIATVNDVTEQVQLAKKLEVSEEQSKRQMEWFLSILHVEPDMLKEFIDGAHTELNEIENILKRETSAGGDHHVLEKIYRSVHLVKGNASLLDLKFYAKKAHNFEEEIEVLKKKNELYAKDFIPLKMYLDDMRSDIDEINKMIEKISQIHTHFRPKRSLESKMLVRSIENLVKRISKEYKKEVQFVHENFRDENIPYQYRLIVKDILIQMARNSLKHGIEKPEEREKCGKSRSGLIEIATHSNNGTFRFKFRDDGRGLQTAKIKEKLKNSGKWRVEEIEKWDEKKIARTIFESGISTSDSTDIVAGRGVGMNIIYQKVKSYKGKIDIGYEKGKYVEFTVSLPNTGKHTSLTL